MTIIVPGMTPTDFIAALNANAVELVTTFDLDVNPFLTLTISNATPVNISYNLRVSTVSYGQKGNSYIDTLNSFGQGDAFALTVSDKAWVTKPSGYAMLPSFYAYPTIYNNTLYAVKNDGSRLASKSVDYGTTWTDFNKIFDAELYSIFATKDGILFVCEGATPLHPAGEKVWRSIDDGANWTNVFTTTFGIITVWQWCQSEIDGTIYAGEYTGYDSDNACYLWKSIDDGANWTRIDLTMYGDRHVHHVMVDPITNRLYVSFGDINTRTYYSDDSGTTWTRIFNTYSAGFVGMTCLLNKRFFSDDRGDGNNNIWLSEDDATLVSVFKPEDFASTSWAEVVYVDGGTTLYCTFKNHYQIVGNAAIIAKSTDSGSTWTIISMFASGVDSHHYHRFARDYRHRIPSGFGYFICNTLPGGGGLRGLIRIPV